jgi:hypothetical protein
MRKIFYTLLFALPLALVLNGVAISQEKSPQIEFDERDHNWGTVFEGEKVTHIFNFTNIGESELVIDKVKSSCGCTAALVSEKVIPPGGKGEVKATFDSSRRAGKQTKTITVTSNDPKEPTAKLSITGLVEHYIQIKPDRVNLGTVFRGETVEQTIRIIPPQVRPNLKITNVETNQEFVKVEMEKTGNWGERFASTVKGLFVKREPTEEEEGIPVFVSLDPEAPVGRVRASLTIETDDERKPKLSVQIVGTVTGSIQVNPQTIAFSPSKDGDQSSKKVTLTSKDIGFEILDIDNKSPHLQVEKIEKEKGKVYEIEVRLSPDTPKGQIRENLVIHTNNKDQATINVPVYGFLQ